MQLTQVQKQCLAQACRQAVHIAEFGHVNYRCNFFGKTTVQSLYAKGFIAATEYFNKYAITDLGQEKVNRFRRGYK